MFSALLSVNLIAHLKEEFHDLIDTKQDEKLLLANYQLIHGFVDNENGAMCLELSKFQREEFLISWDGDFKKENLVSYKEVVSKLGKWL